MFLTRFFRTISIDDPRPFLHIVTLDPTNHTILQMQYYSTFYERKYCKTLMLLVTANGCIINSPYAFDTLRYYEN